MSSIPHAAASMIALAFSVARADAGSFVAGNTVFLAGLGSVHANTRINIASGAVKQTDRPSRLRRSLAIGACTALAA